jgi:hypothetical protein
MHELNQLKSIMDQFILFCLHDPRLKSFFFVMMKKIIKIECEFDNLFVYFKSSYNFIHLFRIFKLIDFICVNVCIYVPLNMVMQNNSLHSCVSISLSTRIGTKSSSYNRIHHEYLLFRPFLEQKRLPFTRKRQELSHKTNQMK